MAPMDRTGAARATATPAGRERREEKVNRQYRENQM